MSDLTQMDRASQPGAVLDELTAARLELHRLRELVKQADVHHIRLRDGIRRAVHALSYEGRSDMTLADVEILVADLRKLLGTVGL